MSEREPLGSAGREYGATVPPVRFADFSPTEFYSLSENIASSVDGVNQSLRALSKMLRQLGSTADSLPLRDKIHKTQQSVNGSVASTARDLQRLGVVVRRGDKPQKLQVERLTHAFKDALANYATVQKQLSEKMQAHLPPLPARAPPPAAAAPLLDPTASAERDHEATLLANQQAQARLVEFETSMLLEREAYVHRIEEVVLDVNQIMAELADIVHSQGQTVDTVESQVESAGAQVSAGAEELAKASGYQNRYRRKLLVLLAVVLVIAVLLVVVIVKSLR